MLHCARRGLSDIIPGLRLANRVISVGGTESQSAAAGHLRNSQLCCLQNLQQQSHCLYSASSPQHAANGQNVPMPPWTPTAQLTKRKVLTKRMGFLLQASQAYPNGSGLIHLPVCLYCSVLHHDRPSTCLFHRHWRQSKLLLLTNPESSQTLVQAMLLRSGWYNQSITAFPSVDCVLLWCIYAWLAVAGSSREQAQSCLNERCCHSQEEQGLAISTHHQKLFGQCRRDRAYLSFVSFSQQSIPFLPSSCSSACITHLY